MSDDRREQERLYALGWRTAVPPEEAHALFKRLTDEDKRRAAYDFFTLGNMAIEENADGTVRYVPLSEWRARRAGP